ncbi:uncharacterized protein N7529_005217 [Penicillium soppii]|jgi:hypothetical protein|uniref:uncharacterized protein n=1 Tax=Penicillium soppii TaxID=69789 RepID=UPI0025494AF9|nr:uncharacterized protein N7529_005217 [Penicillium soppii]KAJ5872864.1 hypothetical protein N7529_005217 [Penicillium soppii]
MSSDRNPKYRQEIQQVSSFGIFFARFLYYLSVFSSIGRLNGVGFGGSTLLLSALHFDWASESASLRQEG